MDLLNPFTWHFKWGGNPAAANNYQPAPLLLNFRPQTPLEVLKIRGYAVNNPPGANSEKALSFELSISNANPAWMFYEPPVADEIGNFAVVPTGSALDLSFQHWSLFTPDKSEDITDGLVLPVVPQGLPLGIGSYLFNQDGTNFGVTDSLQVHVYLTMRRILK